MFSMGISLLVSATLLASSAAREQPGAIDLYPPNIVGTFDTTLDHFRFDNAATVPLRFMGYSKFSSNTPSSPILLYLGNEGAIESFYNNSGGMFELAEELEATVMFIEHRYYGESLPFKDESFTNENIVFLTIEQALADNSEFIVALPQILEIDVASITENTILFGGSYGGMLAAWHRYKYPHMSRGAVASGAPIDFYPDSGIQQQFEDAFIATFETAISGCGSRLLAALAADFTLDEVLSAVPVCDPATASVSKFMFYARGAISSLAMIDYPYECEFISALPANPVTLGCSSIVTDSHSALDVLVGLTNLYVNATGDLPCFDLGAELVQSRKSSPLTFSSSDLGVTSWNYQACTELILEPITSDGFGFYPPADGEQTVEIVETCERTFKALSRPAWMGTSFARGRDVSRYLTNTILMENSKDPWHVGTASIAANEQNGLFKFYAEGGAHHQDLRFSDDADSDGVREARAFEKEIIRSWLAK